jgi:chromosome segregation ATPase
MSERIKSLFEFWDEFENQVVLKITDMRRLTERVSKAQLEIERLENSRNNWRKRCEKAEKELRELKHKK